MRFQCCLLILVFGCFYSAAQSVLPDSIGRRFENVKRDSSFVLALNKLATSYLKSDPSISRKLAAHAGEIAKQIRFQRGYARSLTVVGNAYWYEGIYEFAQNYYMLAARYYQDLEDSVGLGYVFNNIGEVNKKLGDYDNALGYLVRSAALRKNDTTIALTLTNIAELYIMKQNYEEAERYIQQSVEAAKRFNDLRSTNYNHLMLAKVMVAKRSLREAVPHFKRAIEGWKQLGETRSLIQTYQDLAAAHRISGQLERARDYLALAQRLEGRLKVPDLRVRTYLELAKLDSASGNYHAALIHLERHNELRDSIYNIAKAEQIARVQTIYETERKDRENEQLRAEKKLHQQRLASREGLLAAITAGLFIAAILVTILTRQRIKILRANKLLKAKNEEIHLQKESIELQAVALMKLNDELQELNKTLESRIDERSKLLMIQNKKLAEYSFVNAHKLRAPVASILGLIQIMDQVKPDEREMVLRHLKTCSEQLDSIIQEISKNLASEQN